MRQAASKLVNELQRVGRSLVNVQVGARDPNRRRDLDRKTHAAAVERVKIEQGEIEERILKLGWWPCRDPKKWARLMRKLNRAREMQIYLEARPPA